MASLTHPHPRPVPEPAKGQPAAPPKKPNGLRGWPLVRKLLTLVFFGLVVWMLSKQAQGIEWAEVGSAMLRIPVGALLAGGAFALASYTLYATFDLIGRYATGHPLSVPQVMLVTAISYAFNLNLGALVGGFAFRFRLYSRLGLENDVITRVLSLSLITNWLGYLFLAGGLFLFQPLALPPDWKIGSEGLQVLGGVLLAAAVAYLLLCGFASKRSWTIRGHEITLPTWRMALLQFALSCANWMLIGGVVYMLLQQRIDYPAVLSVLLIAAVAGVITHVPAGLGVLEAVFVALLSHRLARGELVAGLLAYRAIYYLVPLALAAVAYLAVELKARRRSSA